MDKPMPLDFDFCDDDAVGETMRGLKDAGCLDVKAGFFGAGGGMLIGVSCMVPPEARKGVEVLCATWGLRLYEEDGELFTECKS